MANGQGNRFGCLGSLARLSTPQKERNCKDTETGGDKDDEGQSFHARSPLSDRFGMEWMRVSARQLAGSAWPERPDSDRRRGGLRRHLPSAGESSGSPAGSKRGSTAATTFQHDPDGPPRYQRSRSWKRW